MRRYRIPDNRAMCARVVIEVVAILVLVYPMMHIYVFLQGDLEPFRRGFFCDDESIKHPDVDEEITVGQCFAIWTAIVLLIVPGVELMHHAVFKQDPPQPKISKYCPWVLIELYRILGYFAIGALCSLLTTEMAKYKIGRLRPYFLDACKIRLTDELCKDKYGYNIFVTDYRCKGNPDSIREASKSFLSGHSSFSFYCATFLIVYLHARLSNLSHDYRFVSYGKVRVLFRGLKILRPFLQFGIFTLAFYICLTRISDYKHHPMDVVSGALVGIFFAAINLLVLLDLFNRPRTFKFESYEDLAAGETHVDGGGSRGGGGSGGDHDLMSEMPLTETKLRGSEVVAVVDSEERRKQKRRRSRNHQEERGLET